MDEPKDKKDSEDLPLEKKKESLRLRLRSKYHKGSNESYFLFAEVCLNFLFELHTVIFALRLANEFFTVKTVRF
jgi:hypothetical protein